MSSPIAWTEEIARVLMIWVMFFGGVVALRRGQHTRITVVIRMLRPEHCTAVELGVNLVVFAFFGILAYQSYGLILLSMKELLPASEVSGAFVSAPMVRSVAPGFAPAVVRADPPGAENEELHPHAIGSIIVDAGGADSTTRPGSGTLWPAAIPRTARIGSNGDQPPCRHPTNSTRSFAFSGS